jgi:threonine synthase
VFDLVGRDPSLTRELFVHELGARGGFELGAQAVARCRDFGFVSGRSTHADRLATIRDTWQRFGSLVDPHTADGLKVARELRTHGERVIVLETALPAKFASTIVEAIGREPERPPELRGLEALPRRCELLPPSVERVKAFIAAHGAA